MKPLRENTANLRRSVELLVLWASTAALITACTTDEGGHELPPVSFGYTTPDAGSQVGGSDVNDAGSNGADTTDEQDEQVEMDFINLDSKKSDAGMQSSNAIREDVGVEVDADVEDETDEQDTGDNEVDVLPCDGEALNDCGECGEIPEETCGDDIDNDCDGNVDEDCVLEPPCQDLNDDGIIGEAGPCQICVPNNTTFSYDLMSVHTEHCDFNGNGVDEPLSEENIVVTNYFGLLVAIFKYEGITNSFNDAPETGYTSSDEAVDACEAIGARLCTAEEVYNVCQAGSHNHGTPDGQEPREQDCNLHADTVGVRPASAFPDCRTRDGVNNIAYNALTFVYNPGIPDYLVGSFKGQSEECNHFWSSANSTFPFGTATDLFSVRCCVDISQ